MMEAQDLRDVTIKTQPQIIEVNETSLEIHMTNLLSFFYCKKYFLFIVVIAFFLIFNLGIYLIWQNLPKVMNQNYQSIRKVDINIFKQLTKENEKIQLYLKTINNLEQKLLNLKIKTNQIKKLPLNLPIVKPNGQKQLIKLNRIEDILYSPDEIKKRYDFHQQKDKFIDRYNRFPFLSLSKSNMILNSQQALVGIKNNQNDWNRLEGKFNLSAIKSQLHMCVIIPGYNNNANFRIQQNLNSVFLQNYTNYKAIIINDASTDGSGEIYRKYFKFYEIDQKNYQYIQNTKRITALENIYKASIEHCSNNSIVVTIDADDQFIGRNVLKVFNWAYQTKKAGVIYSNFYLYEQPKDVKLGFTSEYSNKQKSQNLYRNVRMKFSHLRSYQAQLLHYIDPKDLQDQKGAFFTITYDLALFFPLMEVSCGRVYKIQEEIHYLYNMGTGLNDYNDQKKQISIQKKVRSQKKYECYKPFDQKMNK